MKAFYLGAAIAAFLGINLSFVIFSQISGLMVFLVLMVSNYRFGVIQFKFMNVQGKCTLGFFLAMLYVAIIYTNSLTKVREALKIRQSVYETKSELNDYHNDGHILFNAILSSIYGQTGALESPDTKLLESYALVNSQQHYFLSKIDQMEGTYRDVLEVHFTIQSILSQNELAKISANLVDDKIRIALKYAEFPFLLYQLIIIKIQTLISKNKFDQAKSSLAYAFQINQSAYDFLRVWIEVAEYDFHKDPRVFKQLVQNKMWDGIRYQLKNVGASGYDQLNFEWCFVKALEHKAYALCADLVIKVLPTQKVIHNIKSLLVVTNQATIEDKIGILWILSAYWHAYADFSIEQQIRSAVKQISLQDYPHLTSCFLLIRLFLESKCTWTEVNCAFEQIMLKHTCSKCNYLHEHAIFICSNCKYYHRCMENYSKNLAYFDSIVGMFTT